MDNERAYRHALERFFTIQNAQDLAQWKAKTLALLGRPPASAPIVLPWGDCSNALHTATPFTSGRNYTCTKCQQPIYMPASAPECNHSYIGRNECPHDGPTCGSAPEGTGGM